MLQASVLIWMANHRKSDRMNQGSRPARYCVAPIVFGQDCRQNIAELRSQVDEFRVIYSKGFWHALLMEGGGR